MQRCFQFSSTVASYLKYITSSYTLHLDGNTIAEIRRALFKNLENFIAKHLKTDCISTSRWNLEFSDFIASFSVAFPENARRLRWHYSEIFANFV